MRIVLTAVASLTLASCQTESPQFINLGFEEQCTDASTGMCGWEIAYQANCEISRDSTGAGNAFRIDGHGGVCFVEQILQLPDGFDESILTLSASIKTADVVGKGAGLNLGIYDADSMMILNADMGYGDYNFAQGSEDWSQYSIQAVVPSESASARLGLISYGQGTALFDSVTASFASLKNRRPSKQADEYISKAIDLASQHSLRRDSVDFESIKSQALRIAGSDNNPADWHLATRFILSSLGDHHSFLMTAADRQKWLSEDGQGAADVTLSEARKDGQLGYLWIPGFHSNSESAKQAFARTLQNQILELYRDGVQGWIVDLRDNDGGNMAPMLAGLEPLFTTDTLGYLIDVDDSKEAWGRGDEFHDSEDENYVRVDNPVVLDSDLPIAVLYDGSTGSSGEIVIISFVGQENARSFGTPSMGLTTGNGEFELPDGSYMFMASTRMADRNGVVYTGVVTPDEVVEGNADEVLNAAANWLTSQ